MAEILTKENDNTIENGTIIEMKENGPAPAPITDFPKNSAPEAAPEVQKEPTTEPISQFQTAPAAEPAPQPQKTLTSETNADTFEEVFPEDNAEEEKPKHRFFRSRSEDADFSRDKWILSRIDDEHLMEYLTLEQRRFEQLQEAKEKRDKRIFTAFRLTISLLALTAVVYFLKDNPMVLVNILYIAGILGAIWFWKTPKDKDKEKPTDK